MAFPTDHYSDRVRKLSEANRLLPFTENDAPAHSKFYKSIDFNLVITDKTHLKQFLYISCVMIFVGLVSFVVFFSYLPQIEDHHHTSAKNLTIALHQALTFFDAQKSGMLPADSLVLFRGSSGLKDGNGTLVGGFYDSGNNIKFSFPTAYTVTLLSWTVIEYHEKYQHIGELDHVKDIIRWGSDYLLKVLVHDPNGAASSISLYSQVGSADDTESEVPNDVTCWQRPEDMSYDRPVSVCRVRATDLVGEITAALSSASMVFKDDTKFSKELSNAAEELFEAVRILHPSEQGLYTSDVECGGKAGGFYNSTSYQDELAWGATWLFFATGNVTYLQIATEKFALAEKEEAALDHGLFYWNNKLTATAVLLTRVRFFRDLGYPYETTFRRSSDMTDNIMCLYLSDNHFRRTSGGLIFLRPDREAPLQYAATASFLSKLYSDYLDLMKRSGGSCSESAFSVAMLRNISVSQVKYILGDNPMNMSYVVGYGSNFATKVHHRGASIPWDGKVHSCEEGSIWLKSREPNPNILVGAMVGGPDKNDRFFDERNQPGFTEPTLVSNAGLVAALIALHDPPRKGNQLGIDQNGIFHNIKSVPSTS